MTNLTLPITAGVIHTDFEHSFIPAEVTHFDNLVALLSFATARKPGTRKPGKLRIEDKEYRDEGRRCRRTLIQRVIQRRQCKRMDNESATLLKQIEAAFADARGRPTSPSVLLERLTMNGPHPPNDALSFARKIQKPAGKNSVMINLKLSMTLSISSMQKG